MMQSTDYAMKIEVEDLSGVKKTLNITIPEREVAKEIEKAYQRLKASIKLPGFRPGTVPVSVLKARFKDHITEDVATKIIEGTYPVALKEKSLYPVDMPKFEVKTASIEEGKDFSYTVTVEVNPKIEVDGYRDLGIQKESADLTEKDIEDALERLRQGKSQYKDTEAPAKELDMVIVDFEACVDGKVIKGSNTVDYSVVIGERTPIPGFDEALKGVKAGENKETTLTIPKNYSESGLAGKDALFRITVKAVKEKVTPALDDEFAKDLECDNLAALKEKAAKDLKKIKEDKEKERLKSVVMDRLIEKFKFDVPESLVNRYLSMTLSRILDDMKHGYFRQEDMGVKPEDLKEKYRPMAERQVKEDIILDAIAEKEGLTVSKEEMTEAVKFLAQSRNISYDELMARIEKEKAVDVIKDGLKHGKVFDIILGTAAPEAKSPE